jgi:hypothetical protein
LRDGIKKMTMRVLARGMKKMKMRVLASGS